VEEKD